jgi:N-acyl homoserine lactone hydrolase
MRMHVFSGGRLRLKRRIYFPDAASEETIEVPVASFLIRHAQANVLFDTGCHPAVFGDGGARWGGLAKVMRPIGGRADNVIDDLRSIGIAPDDIDIVACSHLHPDHCGCNAFFTRATVVCHAREIEAARAPGAERAGYLAVEWDHPQPFDAIERERDRIVLIPLPVIRRGRSARSSISTIRAPSSSPPMRSACARTSTAIWPRATPGMRSSCADRSPRSAASRRRARP